MSEVGQKLKSSMGAYVFRSAPNNGHRATTAVCPKSARTGSTIIVAKVRTRLEWSQVNAARPSAGLS